MKHSQQAPVLSEQDVAIEAGNIKMYMFMYEENGTKAFMVAYSDYPKKLWKDIDPVDVLRSSQEGVVEKFEASVTREEVYSFMGHPCIDFAASGPVYNTEYKLVLAGNRLYQVGILSSEDMVKADVDGFIRTFKIFK